MPKLYLQKAVILGGKLYPPESEINPSRKVCDQLIDAGAAVPIAEIKPGAEAKAKADAEAGE